MYLCVTKRITGFSFENCFQFKHKRIIEKEKCIIILGGKVCFRHMVIIHHSKIVILFVSLIIDISTKCTHIVIIIRFIDKEDFQPISERALDTKISQCVTP